MKCMMEKELPLFLSWVTLILKSKSRIISFFTELKSDAHLLCWEKPIWNIFFRPSTHWLLRTELLPSWSCWNLKAFSWNWSLFSWLLCRKKDLAPVCLLSLKHLIWQKGTRMFINTHSGSSQDNKCSWQTQRERCYSVIMTSWLFWTNSSVSVFTLRFSLLCSSDSLSHPWLSMKRYLGWESGLGATVVTQLST